MLYKYGTNPPMLRLEEATILHSKMVGPSPNAPKPPTIKFLCSYGGRILPRYPDGSLRYHGGHTRLLAVPRSISFSELMVKLGEICGKTVRVSLRCQLPNEDLDALVSVTSDEDLMNLVEEYDRAPCLQSSSLKIRAFLSIPKKCSPSPSSTPSTASGSGTGTGTGTGSSSSTGTPAASPKSPATVTNRCVHTSSKPPVQLPFSYNKSAGKVPCYGYRNSNRFCLVPNGNHWQ